MSNDICKCGHEKSEHDETQGCIIVDCSCQQSYAPDDTTERMAAVVSAAILWRNSGEAGNYHAIGDENCDCADCQLMDAVDRYTEMISTPKEK